MPTVIPNIMNGYQSPLGNAFKGLASVLMAQPTQAEQMQQGAQYRYLRAQGDALNQKAATDAAQSASRSKLGTLLADPRLYDNTFRPNATPVPAALGDMGVESSPINRAFQPNYGDIIKSTIDSGYKPDDLAKLLLVGTANGSGARSDLTQNAQVGSGESYGNTANAFDTGEQTKMDVAAGNNRTSRQNNADTNAAENARAAAQRANQLTIAGMTDDRADRRAQMAQDKADKKEALANQQRVTSADVVLGKVDEALGKVSGLTSGAIGHYVGKVAGTPGYTLDRDLDTIKANLSFDTLQAMRSASPTGGALGQVSDYENKMLASTVAALDTGLNPSELKANLEAVKKHYANVKALAEGKPIPFPSPGDKAAAAPAAGGGVEHWERGPDGKMHKVSG
jgi:hypothetical protein